MYYSFFNQVYLPALVGHLPDEVIKAFCAFMDFCYLVRRSILNDDSLMEIERALERFYGARQIFQELGVQESFSVPRLHAMLHYKKLIRLFGAPNGLCSSITESKHIDAVKKPWRRSNRYNALGQMLKTNSRLDNLRASRVYFRLRNMFKNLFFSEGDKDDEEMIADESSLRFEGYGNGPTVVNSIALASTPRKHSSYTDSN